MSAERPRRTGLVWHELFMWHDTSALAGFVKSGRGIIEPDEAAEKPATKRRMKNLLDVAGLSEHLIPIKVRAATDAELALVHAPAYVDAIKSMSAKDGGDASLGAVGGDTPFGPGGFDIAAMAVGGILEAVDAILEGRVDNAYALIRPPGHHAERDHGFGFCIFNNCALAARYIQNRHGLARVAVVDWDVHHGNGAEHIFWDDPAVLTISIHQDGLYPPGSGALSARGGGRGSGYNVNVPLPPGSGTGAYLAVIERIVVPALQHFAPHFIVVACGFDAGAYDPMARMMLHPDAFRAMTRQILHAAGALCGGRVLFAHEGGYHTLTVPFHGLAVIEELSGRNGSVADAFTPIIAAMPYQDLQPHQDAIIQKLQSAIAESLGSKPHRTKA
jgi:acetoin utilization deacetylase AcuC-like enzyme